MHELKFYSFFYAYEFYYSRLALLWTESGDEEEGEDEWPSLFLWFSWHCDLSEVAACFDLLFFRGNLVPFKASACKLESRFSRWDLVFYCFVDEIWFY